MRSDVHEGDYASEQILNIIRANPRAVFGNAELLKAIMRWAWRKVPVGAVSFREPFLDFGIAKLLGRSRIDPI